METARNITRLMSLLQFSDSALPVGTFSFSGGLESAVHAGIVTDADSLERYTHAALLQAAFTDGVAALEAHRAACIGDYDALLHTDRQLLQGKMNGEARLMAQRMGRKLAELSVRLYPQELSQRWLSDIRAGAAPGCYSVAQGVLFSLAGASQEELFTCHQYGVAGMVLNAALRCVKVSHYDTQGILHRLSPELVPRLFRQAQALSVGQIHAFVPQLDILAALHEKGTMRMFMN